MPLKSLYSCCIISWPLVHRHVSDYPYYMQVQVSYSGPALISHLNYRNLIWNWTIQTTNFDKFKTGSHLFSQNNFSKRNLKCFQITFPESGFFFSRYSVLYIKYLNLNWHLIKGKGGGLKQTRFPWATSLTLEAWMFLTLTKIANYIHTVPDSITFLQFTKHTYIPFWEIYITKLEMRKKLLHWYLGMSTSFTQRNGLNEN